MTETLFRSNNSSELHLHVISMHTSPLAQPGQGDAGGMNVYIDRSIRALLADFPQLSVEVFTLASSPTSRKCEQVSERAIVHFIELEEAFGANKSDLPYFVDAFVREVARCARRKPDIIHAHYWLSGLAALAYSAGAPVVQTMHTTAAAKDARAESGEPAEPGVRYAGEERIVRECAALIVNTEFERDQMIKLYGADPQKICIIEPGVDTGVFRPLPREPALHAGSGHSAQVVFAGRPQALKGPQILVEALALLPSNLSVELLLIGRSETDFEKNLLVRAAELGVSEQIELLPPVSSRELARFFRRADIVACPSSSETFGLVALEAQACGTAVLATRADGLIAAVEDQKSGILVPTRDAQTWARAIELLVRSPQLRAQMGEYAHRRASKKTWTRTAHRLMHLYLLHSTSVLPSQSDSLSR